MHLFDWKPNHPNASKPKKLAPVKKAFGIGSIAATILARRGLTTIPAINKYLHGTLKDQHSPYLFPDMIKAVSRILYAKTHNEKVFIHGDYDCDGIMSASLLKIMCDNLGIEAKPFVPTRALGYGLSLEAVEMAKEFGATLLITSDCGSNEHKAHSRSKKYGIDTIVLDHHSFKKRPKVHAFINPNEGYPFNCLCGTGVVFKLLVALNDNVPTYPEEYTDIVAIATIADSEPIIDENRLIVKEGLKKLQKTSNLGLAALLEVSSLTGRKMNTEMVGFIVSPKINAPGRIDDPNKALELILTQDGKKAKKLAKEIAAINRERMKINREIREEAVEMVEKNYMDDTFLVLSNDKWHKGVIGIVASTMVEMYHKPCAIISKGYCSVRTVPEFKLLKPLAECSDLLVRWGGHPMAAGLKIYKKNIDSFRKKINKVASKVLPSNPVPYMNYDIRLKLKDVSVNLVNDLEKFEPFGMGNPKPMFTVEDVLVPRSRVTKDKNHLQITVKQDKRISSGIGFWLAEKAEQIIDPAQKFDVLFSLERSQYGTEQMMIQDLKEVTLEW